MKVVGGELRHAAVLPDQSLQLTDSRHAELGLLSDGGDELASDTALGEFSHPQAQSHFEVLEAVSSGVGVELGEQIKGPAIMADHVVVKGDK